MGGVYKRWRVFWTAVGARHYGLADAAKIAAAIVAFAYLYFFGREMTTVEIVLSATSFVLLLLLLWIMLEFAVQLTDQISDARVKLSDLRVRGVELRNEATTDVTDVDAYAEWETQVNAWAEDVLAALEKISKADAVWFSTLDIVPPPRIPPCVWPVGESISYGPFEKLYREHDCRLARLGEMIRELWSKTR